MKIRALVRLHRFRLMRAVRHLVRRYVPRDAREARPVVVELAAQSHGAVIRSRVNLTLRASVLAAQTPLDGYVSHATSPFLLLKRKRSPRRRANS